MEDRQRVRERREGGGKRVEKEGIEREGESGRGRHGKKED